MKRVLERILWTGLITVSIILLFIAIFLMWRG